jgi:CHAT domain-containing protein
LEQGQEHLTDAQVEQCGRLRPNAGPVEIELHLSGCGFCLERLLNWQRIEFKRFEMAGMREEAYPDCRSDEEIRDVAAGMVSAEDATRILEHAAHCDHCGPLLNQYFEIFSAETSPEIEALIDQSPSSRPGWARAKAREIVAKMAPAPPVPWTERLWNFVVPPRVLAGAASLAVLIFAASTAPEVVAAWQFNKAQDLTAAASAKYRVSPMRSSNSLSGQYPGQYQGPQGTMGNSQLDELRRPELNKVWSMLSDKSSSGRLDPKWLQLRGEILLLKDPVANGKSAEKSFRDAQSGGLDDPGLKIDLAISYFEEDRNAQPASPNQSHHPTPRFIRSIELLTQVLRHPKLTDDQKRVALFNLAIAYEESAMWMEAIATWDEYLKADPAGPWHNEAQARRDADEASRRKSSGRISFDPLFYLAHFSEAAVQDNTEEYLERAAPGWSIDGLRQPNGTAAQAISALANELKKKHADGLLSDLLANLRSTDLPALLALSAALKANRDDKSSAAREHARTALDLFARSHNHAGEAWAGFQEVYAYQREQSGSDCLKTAADVDRRLEGRNYPWLQGQLALERAICRNFSEAADNTEIDADLAKSLHIATQFGFPILRLRIIGMSPGIKRQQSLSCGDQWNLALEGMKEYWNGIYPRERLYQFYSVLEQCAEQENYWNVAKTLMGSMIAMRLGMEKQDQDLNVVVALYVHLASICTSLGDDPGAQHAIQQAEAVFQQGETQNQRFRAITRIRLAESQLGQARAEKALQTLAPARDVIDIMDNPLVAVDFKRVMGKILLRLERLTEAEEEYRTGIEDAERSLSGQKLARQRVEWAGKTEELYRGLAQVWLAQKRIEDAWKLWEWSKDRSMFAQSNVATHKQSPSSWPELQQAILALPIPSGPDLRLVYAVFDDRLHVWMVSNGKVGAAWTALGRDKLEKLVDSFVRKCADPSSPLQELRDDGKTLYSLLLDPFAGKSSDGKTLILEMDQQLWRLPVQALTTPDGRYVAEKYYVGYSPGVLVETRLRQPANMEPRNTLSVVEAYPGLVGILTGISDRFSNPIVLTGAATNNNEVLNAVRRSAIFFFFGHAVSDDHSVALKLNDQDLLRAANFTPETTANLSHVVLAACSTGSGEQYGPLDTGGLVRAFLAGGVPEIVASQWDVYTLTTRDITNSFFENRRGAPATRAMAKAQREFLRSNLGRANQHPYYWAGFIVVGRQEFTAAGGNEVAAR